MLCPAHTLRIDTTVRKTMGIKHLDEQTIFMFSKKNVLLLIQGAETFVKND